MFPFHFSEEPVHVVFLHGKMKANSVKRQGSKNGDSNGRGKHSATPSVQYRAVGHAIITGVRASVSTGTSL